MRLMGIVNVTPDSFSDGGLYLDADAAITHGKELAAEGADVLDVGGESTRPGAEAVDPEEERRRVTPVVAALADASHVVSIDTSKSSVAEAALDEGAHIVNDVTAFRGDPDMASLCAERACDVVLMHMLGTPRTMQDEPRYDDVVEEVRAFLAERIDHAVAAGVAEDRIWIDPGIGFGKALEHNLELLRRLGELRELGRPILVGASRKRFIGAITGRAEGKRVGGTVAASILALEHGADAVRVHDVREIREAMTTADAITRRRDWGVDERMGSSVPQ